MKGDSVIITASPEDIERIQKLNGFTFAGAPLVIQACDPPPQKNAKSEGDKKSDVSPSTVETKERFRTILAGRYDSNLKLLNLSALAMDPGLKEMGVFDGSTTTSKIFPALMVVCDGLFKTRKEKAEAIVSVTLADNGLDSVSDVNSLAQTFPDIKNLDLSRNKFTGLKSLDPWRHKFRYLENLLLHGNPMEANLPIDKDELLDRYPNLQSINGHQVRSPGEIAAAHAAAEAAKSPIPIATPNFRDVGQVGEKFTKQYLTLYDNDRNALLANFYDHETSFSLAINMTAPRDRKNSAPIPPWAPYTQYSRNLTKVTHLPTRINRRFRGVQAIQPVWNNLPRTRHPSLQTEAYKYIIECEPLPGLPDPSGQSARGVDGLLLIIHGEYEEPNPSSPTEKALRSFTRTFALGPGRSGGQPIRVISDTLTLRAWGPLAQPTTGPSIQQTINNPEQMQQEAVTRQLVERTGMTPDYAILCLTETRWDLEKAFFAFERNRVCIHQVRDVRNMLTP
jgi:nuclear RNA export factor